MPLGHGDRTVAAQGRRVQCPNAFFKGHPSLAPAGQVQQMLLLGPHVHTVRIAFMRKH